MVVLLLLLVILLLLKVGPFGGPDLYAEPEDVPPPDDGPGPPPDDGHPPGDGAPDMVLLMTMVLLMLVVRSITQFPANKYSDEYQSFWGDADDDHPPDPFHPATVPAAAPMQAVENIIPPAAAEGPGGLHIAPLHPE